ncbi:IclR family transcriptional regulator [Pseudomonas sp. TH10]|uniref:IclR family transcriptional regulator n=1 Tax=Pseudomonas sp. TH10 TaxID=2796376 RepID=UPI0019115552|nr:IclR family transcriptional regulator C-terminal domain-containing protein [Pseudomonas sp. TH10]MBK5516261.1 helix-turn-helix domain-containing protein [Pseudomonas sp. TH10]
MKTQHVTHTSEMKALAAQDAKGSSQDRLMRLLELFSGDTKNDWSVDEAAVELGLSASHTYRYFRTLSVAGYISAFTPGRYVLGPAIIALDRKMRVGDPMIQSARLVMGEMLDAAPSGSIAILCRYFRGQVMCVHEEFTTRFKQDISYERGLPRPLYQGAASKVILAHLPLRQVKPYYEAWMAEFDRFGLGIDWAQVKQTLRTLRNEPAVITSGELGNSAAGISAAIFDDKRVIGSISLVIPVVEASHETKTRLAPLVAQAGAVMTQKMTALASSV